MGKKSWTTSGPHFRIWLFSAHLRSTSPRYFQKPARKRASSEMSNVRLLATANASAFNATFTELPSPLPQKSAAT